MKNSQNYGMRHYFDYWEVKLCLVIVRGGPTVVSLRSTVEEDGRRTAGVRSQ